jgi:hypothetical protein
MPEECSPETQTNFTVTRLVLLTGVVLSILAMMQVAILGTGTGTRFLFGLGGRYLALIGVLAIPALGMLAMLVITFTHRACCMTSRLSRAAAWMRKLGWFNWVLFVLLVILLPALIISPLGSKFSHTAFRAYAFWWLAVLAAAVLQAACRMECYANALLTALLILGLAYQVAYNASQISDTPLTIAWSEGSRYYYASTFFSQTIYGAQQPLPVLDPARYLMQTPPLILQLPIAWHRLWEGALWLGFSALAALALARRFRWQKRGAALLFCGWLILLFLQGPIYYHLLGTAILVLWWFNPRRFWRSLLVVIAASILAGLTRINWFPMPGVLAAVLYLLEVDCKGKKFVSYVMPPVVWGIAGLGTAFLVKTIYISLSGNPAEFFNSALYSDLLWDRLLPNSTYPPGMILGSLTAYLALAVMILFKVFHSRQAWHWMRLSLLGLILLAFYGAGMVVSIKIGAGSNLHNLDTFIFLFAVVASYIFMDRFTPDEQRQPATIPQWLLLLIAIVPVTFAAGFLQPFYRYDRDAVRSSLTEVQQLVNEYAPQGQVLFLAERQLLTFDELQVKSFEALYEKFFLMEMVMANNQPYLSQFYEGLQNHRYPLIVSPTILFNYQDRSHNFSEENNMYIDRVTQPLTQYYRTLQDFPALGVTLLIPKTP